MATAPPGDVLVKHDQRPDVTASLAGPAGQWLQRDAGGHVCWLYEPPQRHPSQLAVLFLHDHGGNVPQSHPNLLRQLDRHGLTLVAPCTGDTWWLDCKVPGSWEDQTPQQFLSQVVIPSIREWLEVEPPRIGALGWGMGGQGALMLAYRQPRRIPVVAAIAPAIDFHLLVPEYDPVLTETFGDREWARQHTAILHVHPLNYPPRQFFCCDPMDYEWFDSSDRLRMKLSSIGIPFECELELSCEGDRNAYEDVMAERAVEFLVSGLEAELRKG